MEAVARVEAAPRLTSNVPAEVPRPARTLLVLGAIALVVSGLTWRLADAGIGWLLVDAVLVGAILAGVGRGRPGSAACALGATSVWLAGATCWRASDWALAAALPGSVVTLLAAGLLASRRAGMQDVGDLPRASLDALRALPGGIVDAARLPGAALGTAARDGALGVLRGLLIGVPLALFFAALLAADAGFRHAVERILGRSGEGIDLTLWTLATLSGLLVSFALLYRLQRARGEVHAAEAHPASVPYRTEGDAAVVTLARPRTGPRVPTLTWAVVLAQVLAVFGIYVVANASTLFEGHAHLRAVGTGTYAGYLHEGFTQVSIATLLAVACVVLGHALLRPREGAARIPGGRALVAIELGLLALVGVTLASCAHRLSLYEEAYGYTYLRLAVWLLQLGVAGLLAMTGARCIARAWTGWGSALAWSAVAFAVLAGSLDADGWIARRNVDRVHDGAPLDVDYLASLSEDARAVLPEVYGMDRDKAAYLASIWSDRAAEHRAGGWRARRGVGSR
jgi:two-component system sensor histidine kinase BaeS